MTTPELSKVILILILTSFCVMSSSFDSSLMHLLREQGQIRHPNGLRPLPKVPEVSVRPGSVVFSASKPRDRIFHPNEDRQEIRKRTGSSVKVQNVCKSVSDWFAKVSGLFPIFIPDLFICRKKQSTLMATS